MAHIAVGDLEGTSAWLDKPYEERAAVADLHE
jgi:hypothetical protein